MRYTKKNSFKVKYFKNGIELSSLFYLEIAIGEIISALAMLQASQPAAFVHCSSLKYETGSPIVRNMYKFLLSANRNKANGCLCPRLLLIV